MTNSKETIPTSETAAEVNARAAAWLRRRSFGDWTDQDEAELNVWLAEATAHRVAYWRLNAAWSRADRLAALRRRTPESAIRNSASSIFAWAAASFVVIVALGVGVRFWITTPNQANYATAVGEHKTIVLADGSAIELNTDTAIHVDTGADFRTVSLVRGEAYFRIKHDPARPFVVTAAGHSVTDIGTEFRIRQDNGRLEVALLEGRARFDSADVRSQPVSMVPGDVVIATAHSTAVMKKSPRDLADALDWRRGMIVFKHATLADAATEFNRYNVNKVVIEGSAVMRMTINGTFQTNDIGAFTDAAHAVFGLHVQARGEETVISR